MTPKLKAALLRCDAEEHSFAPFHLSSLPLCPMNKTVLNCYYLLDVKLITDLDFKLINTLTVVVSTTTRGAASAKKLLFVFIMRKDAVMN